MTSGSNDTCCPCLAALKDRLRADNNILSLKLPIAEYFAISNTLYIYTETHSTDMVLGLERISSSALFILSAVKIVFSASNNIIGFPHLFQQDTYQDQSTRLR